MARTRKNVFLKKILVPLFLILTLGMGLVAYGMYYLGYKSNTGFTDKKSRFLYIKSTDDFNDVLNQLRTRNLIRNLNTFKLIASLKRYPSNIKPGKYRINRGMSNNQIVNILKAGLHEKVKLNLYNINTLGELCARVSKHLEADSMSISSEFLATNFEKHYDIPNQASLALVIANEYELNWATPAKDLLKLFKTEYEKFWNAERTSKARKLGLTKTEVIILASIVQKEQNLHPQERPKIASVYYNRLKKGMKLQADPTVIYATGDFSINRVLDKHLKVNSPYNTYQILGLPPGPICIPTQNAIDAVLNLPQTNYLYFCAKEDLSGYHHFTENYKDHLAYAKKYRQALDRKGIK